MRTNAPAGPIVSVKGAASKPSSGMSVFEPRSTPKGKFIWVV